MPQTLATDQLPQANGVNFSNVTVASTTAANVTSLGFAIGANESWSAEFHLTIQGATNGCKFLVTSPSGATVRLGVLAQTTSATSAMAFESSATTIGATLTASANAYMSANFTGKAIITVAATAGATPGTIQLQIATISGTNTITVLQYSHMTARKV